MTSNKPIFQAGMHPLEIGKYYVITPVIYRLCLSLKKWIRGMRSGCIIYGYSRIGKTRAIDALVDLLPAEFPGLAVIRHAMLEHQKRTEKEFFRNILCSIQHERSDFGNAGIKRDILVDFITEQANSNPQKRTVIFIDEAQWIKSIEYGYLRGVYNSLEERGIIPMFIFVGDRNLYDQYRAYMESKNREITGRFMSETFEFIGIRGETEVNLVLNNYDSMDAPTGSGWTFTRYYFPSAFDAGWRLTSQSKNLWHTFCDLRTEKKNRRLELYMSDLAPVVQYFLTQFGDDQVIAPMFASTCWREAFQFVGITEHNL